METFKGRAFLPGTITGEAVVSHSAFNTLASFLKSILMKSKKAVCNDQDNPEIFKKVLNGKVLCIPQTIGSTTAGLVFMNIVEMGIEPKAILFSKNIDSLAVAGVLLSDIWMGKRIITVDRLGDEFLDYVKDGMQVEIIENGTVIIN